MSLSERTNKSEVELYNWCARALEKPGRYDTDDQCYDYIYWNLNIMNKCSKNGVPILLHRNHRRLIEENLLKALRKYFGEYMKYQEDLLLIYHKEGYTISRHMLCKYPFLKKYLEH